MYPVRISFNSIHVTTSFIITDFKYIRLESVISKPILNLLNQNHFFIKPALNKIECFITTSISSKLQHCHSTLLELIFYLTDAK
jgi:hypothetical protein